MPRIVTEDLGGVKNTVRKPGSYRPAPPREPVERGWCGLHPTPPTRQAQPEYQAPAPTRAELEAIGRRIAGHEPCRAPGDDETIDEIGRRIYGDE